MLDAMLQSKHLQRELATKIKNDDDLHKLLSKVVLNHDETKVAAEKRKDDPEWFEGFVSSEDVYKVIELCIAFELKELIGHWALFQ